MRQKRKKVLIFTNSRDEHASLVVPVLESFNAQVYRFDTDRISKLFRVNIDINDNSFKLKTPVGELVSKDIHSVWVRRPYQIESPSDNIQYKFKYSEMVSFIRTLPELTKALIVDSPIVVEKANLKVLQIKRAIQLGI